MCRTGFYVPGGLFRYIGRVQYRCRNRRVFGKLVGNIAFGRNSWHNVMRSEYCWNSQARALVRFPKTRKYFAKRFLNKPPIIRSITNVSPSCNFSVSPIPRNVSVMRTYDGVTSSASLKIMTITVDRFFYFSHMFIVLRCSKSNARLVFSFQCTRTKPFLYHRFTTCSLNAWIISLLSLNV